MSKAVRSGTHEASSGASTPGKRGSQPYRYGDLSACDGKIASEQAIVATFVSAWESADLDALVALLTDDVFIAVAPMPSEHRAETSWPACAPASSARADGSTSCRRDPTVSRRSEPTCAPLLTRFDNSVLTWFGLSRSLPH